MDFKKAYRFLMALAAILASAQVSAQEDKGRLTDNLFVSAGAGFNTILDNGYCGEYSAAVDLAAGKWVAPGVAVRLGWHGLRNHTLDASSGWFAGDEAFGYHYAHLDWVLDPVQAVRYKTSRFAMAAPYATAGVIVTSHKGNTHSEFGAGLGLLASVRLYGRLSALADAQVVFAREEAFRNAGQVIAFPSLTAGVSYEIGRQGFPRKIQRELAVLPCAHDEEITGLRRQIDSLKAIKPVVLHRTDTVTVERLLTHGDIIYFDLNGDTISAREQAHLEYLLSFFVGHQARFELCGHADKETGNARHNLDLSRRRVERAKALMLRLGVNAEDITTDYKGDTANTFDTAPKNRCVTVRVVL